MVMFSTKRENTNKKFIEIVSKKKKKLAKFEFIQNKVKLTSGEHFHMASSANVEAGNLIQTVKTVALNSSRAETSTQSIVAVLCGQVSSPVAPVMPKISLVSA